MLVLFETAMGYCLFKMSKSASPDDQNIWKEFETPEKANKLLKLKAIHRFTTTATAVEDMTALQDGKVGPGLKKFLSDEVAGKGKGKESLLVAETHLATAIKDLLSIKTTAGASNMDLYRGIRGQLASLLDGLDPKDLSTMSLGLSHSLSRFKIKFSPDKVDTMIVQAIALLDDLDKEINIYAMRVKEWYGWHFPELAKIIVDNIAYAKVIKHMGFRTNASSTSFATILPEDLEQAVKAAAEISMGTEISDSDIAHIHSLCDQVISISAYRTQLSEYLRNRMNAIAPNLTVLVGELVGARLISHAGSLMSLAKHPASKMARMVATKAALSIRLDALADSDGKSEPDAPSIGLAHRAKLESRLRAMEYEDGATGVRRFAGNGKQQQQQRFDMSGQTKTYNTKADDVDFVSTQREDPIEIAVKAVSDVKEDKKKAKEERRAKRKAEKEKGKDADGDVTMNGDEEEEKKDKKRKRRESEIVNGHEEKEETEEERKARKKARKAEKAAAKETNGDSSPKKKKKKSD
ncbi:uncharacterized protein EV420DRAFT_1501008 [Desarmillaria tabescens]|uniref:Nucleolar protein 58 n=1 Tax=Armillaria tabescens TaxID=1929756 RepID=A0AA39TZV0_ARMTA|nr:uncharacterized protein EV420DRAFT_1501008 [Desarmillaria tabescens]KAK0467714.1 hypothetical protein EV420DRAFT_1501008 [Desarmillaria tabescens]